MVPQVGIVAIPQRANSEDDLIPNLQRALPGSNDELMTMAIALTEPVNSHDSKYLNISRSLLDLNCYYRLI